jgi:hypothetical protein
MASIERANRAAEQVGRATADSYKVVLDQAVAQQSRNIRYAQGLVSDATREVRQQAESNRALTQQFVERAEQQRSAVQTLVEESVDAYMDLLYAPLSYYRQGLRLVENNEQGGDFPIANYDDLNVADISKQIDGLSVGQLQEVRDYEQKNKNRETLIEQFDRKIRSAS